MALAKQKPRYEPDVWFEIVSLHLTVLDVWYRLGKLAEERFAPLDTLARCLFLRKRPGEPRFQALHDAAKGCHRVALYSGVVDGRFQPILRMHWSW